jgi:trehalose-phosphatase
MSITGAAELNQWVAKSDRLWLFLDYDGTLVEFTPTLDSLHPDTQVIEVLTRLAGKPRLRLVVISGRPLTAIQALLPVPGIFLAGVYGVELQTPAGEKIDRADHARIRPFLEYIKPQWQEIITGRAGFFLEDKGWALALHADSAADIETMQVIATAWKLLTKASIPEQFRMFTGSRYLEIAPALAHKGKAVSFLISRYPWAAQPLYIGDDDKDEEAFETIHSYHGRTVLVSPHSASPHAMSADYTLESPAAVLNWLRNLI